MARRMSMSMTKDAVYAGVKFVTRRHVDTWKNLRCGEGLIFIEQGMGLPAGAKQVVIREGFVTHVQVEPIGMVNDAEVVLEGLALPAQAAVDAGRARSMADWFIEFWCEGHGYRGLTDEQMSEVECRRINFDYRVRGPVS